MSISTFARGRNDDDPALATSGVGPSTNLTAFIDQGSSFEGKLSFKDTVRIDGGFEGEITSENTLIVGESGNVTALIRSSVVVISGTVVGNIHARAKVVIHKTGRVEGDVESPCLVVEEGATLNGVVRMAAPSTVEKAKQPLPATPSPGASSDPGSSHES